MRMQDDRMSISEFIDLTNQYPTEWIHYCEILLTASGDVILARPSHQEAVIHYAMQYQRKSRAEILNELREDLLSPCEFYCGMCNLICVWYDYLIIGQPINRLQKHSLDILKHNKLIDNNIAINVSNEYSNYLLRRSLKGLK